MKKYILILAIVGLAGCALRGSKSDSSTDTTPSEESAADSVSLDVDSNSTTPAAKAAADEKNTERAQEKAAAVSAASKANLGEAVKAQSDESIYASATQVLAQSPNDVKALNALAMYHYKQGHVELARYLLNRALSVNANAMGVYSNLGLVQLAQDEKKEAIKSFRKALSIKNDDVVAAANLGSIYVQEKDYAKALPALEVACSKDQKDPAVWNNYAVALMVGQKFDQAAEIFKKLMKENAPGKEILFNYATLLVDDLNKYQDGLDVINRLKFVGEPGDKQNRIIALENKAKAGLK